MILQPTSENVDKAVQLLLRGEIVAIPTETVYGLAGDGSNESAITKIYSTKERPSFNPLISHYSSLEKAKQDVILNNSAIKLFEKFSPGPLTIILLKSEDSRICRLATSGLNTAAIRIPSHPVTQKILQAIDLPIVAPSANPSNRISPVSAEHVEKLFNGSLNFILDGGICEIGLESTIIDLSTNKPTILRNGSITKEMIESVIGEVYETNETLQIKSPGMLAKHYAPKCGLRIGFENPQQDEAALIFGRINPPEGFSTILNLSPKEDLNEAAKNLFNYMHYLEEKNVSGIACMLVPDEKIGKAINDKLKRALN